MLNFGSLAGVEVARLIRPRLLCRLIRQGQLGYLNHVGLMSACAKFQLSSWPRSCLKDCGWVVWGGWFQVATESNLNTSCFRVALSRFELS